MEGTESTPLPLKVQVSDTISSIPSGGASTNATIGPTAPTGLKVELSSGYILNDPLGKHPILIKDPLSEVTRKERKAFLGLSILAIAVIKANLIPNKISAFGVEIDHVKRGELITVLTAVVFYFLLVFIAYAYSDFLGWRIAFWEGVKARTIERERERQQEQAAYEPDSDEVQECERHRIQLSAQSIPASGLRGFLDFLLPIFVGIAALMVLRGCA